MTRFASPQKTHRPKDLCTIEQAEEIANIVFPYRIAEYFHHREQRRWYRRLWRRITKPFTRKATTKAVTHAAP